MKKLTVLSLAGLLILALGATAYAQKLEFRASGFIDAQTFIGQGVPQYNGAAGLFAVVNPTYSLEPATSALRLAGIGPFGTNFEGSSGYNKIQSNWEMWAHLKFDAVMGPNLSGTIYFEIDANRFGSSYGQFGIVGSTPWSPFSGNGREAHAFGGWTTDRTAVQVKNIYFDVGLPYFGIPWPMTVRVGAQPIGVRPAIMVYSDGTGVTAGIKIDPVLINPIYAKAVSSPDFTHQDSDVYGLQANAKFGTITVGGYGLYYRMATYPFFAPSGVIAVTPADIAGTVPVVQGTMSSNMWWLGAYAEGKAGPVDFNFDFIYDVGKVDDHLSEFPHVNYQGWVTRLNVEYPWEKFKFGATGMYGSGSDARHTSPNGLPGTLTSIGTLSKTVRGFVVPPGSEAAPINSESIVMYSMEAGATGGYGIGETSNYASMCRGPFGGTWFAKVYGSVKLTPWYKITAQALYIGDTTVHGNTFGDALKPNGQFRDDKTIGVELDIMNDIQIYNNLRFWLGFGYMFAGKAMDISNAAANLGPIAGFPANVNLGVPRNFTPENPWAFRTKLIYTF